VDAGRASASTEEQRVNQDTSARRPAAPGGANDRVLGLQGAIGNRAVALLLRQTDPRLTYTPAAVAEGTGLDATPLPFTAPGSGNPDAGWDSNEILSKLTQVDESAATFTDQVRCGANSVLAIAINRGPRDTIAWARALMRKGYAAAEDKGKTEEGRRESRSLGDKVWESIARMERATATYGDLSNIAHHAKVLLSNNPSGATTGHEVAAMIGLLGGMQSSSTPLQDQAMFVSYVRDLKRREAFIMLVDTSVLATATRTRNLSQTNHYVVVGKDAGGKAFLYDPYPRVGTQFLRTDAPQQAFWTLFQNAQGDWKSVYIFARPKFE
jgi:hypothetical protein